MSTHRRQQLAALADELAMRAEQLEQAAFNAASIGNMSMATHFIRKNNRLNRILRRVRRRMALDLNPTEPALS